ncbi:MAG: PilN domain-containing protein [candidate division Zixibacteria bacterium]|nr:PilN domain-containing protein [candidate division Zixibacteria bacterium]
MIHINLLPKEYLKSKKSFSVGKSGMYVVAGVAAVVAMLIGVTFWQIHQIKVLDEGIARANQRAAMLRQDIQMVDALTDVKAKITERMQAVERLDRHRSAWVRLLENIAADIPEFVWLGKFNEKVAPVKAGPAAPSQPHGGEGAAKAASPAQAGAGSVIDTVSVRDVEIEGYAFTLNAIAAFMIKLMQSDYFDQVELVKSEEKKFNEDEKAYLFTLSARAHYLSDDDLRNLAAKADQDAASASAPTEQQVVAPAATPASPNPQGLN